MPSEIEVIITLDGRVILEVIGATGTGCLELSKALEEALGSVESRECKIEFYESVGEGEQLQQREG